MKNSSANFANNWRTRRNRNDWKLLRVVGKEERSKFAHRRGDVQSLTTKEVRRSVRLENYGFASSDLFDLKRTIGRRAKRLARRAAAKRKKYGWNKFVRGTSTHTVNVGQGEREIAKNRKSQRKLERWVMKIGVWKLELGFNKLLHYVKDTRKTGGLDFEVHTRVRNKLIGRIDAKSEFKTTPPQDRQIAQAWKDGIPVFLVSRTKYLPITPWAKRKANGSIWG